MWELSGTAYKYKIETSNDNVNWTLKVDKTNNTSYESSSKRCLLRYRPVCQNYRYRTAKRRLGQLLRFQGVWRPNQSGARTGRQLRTVHSQAIRLPAESTATLQPFGVLTDGDTGHWVTVDLGYAKKITYGTQVSWAKSGVAYQYKIETSMDNTNWTLKVDKTGNTDTSQVQNDYLPIPPGMSGLPLPGCQAAPKPASTTSRCLETQQSGARQDRKLRIARRQAIRLPMRTTADTSTRWSCG